MGRRTKDDLEPDEAGQPPKKRGKGKGKKEPGPDGGPKRVFVCPHCQVQKIKKNRFIFLLTNFIVKS